jgi:hypothetical protein
VNRISEKAERTFCDKEQALILTAAKREVVPAHASDLIMSLR